VREGYFTLLILSKEKISQREREGYFALLILNKWEFREEYVQTIKCLLHICGANMQ